MEMDQMKEQENDDCCDWRRWWHVNRHRRSRIGIFLIIIGGLWLGAKLGFFDPAISWPLAFITMGTWLIVSSALRDKKSK